MKVPKPIKPKIKTSLSDKIFILGIYMLFFSGGISNLKISISGISITQEGGKPFLYEIAALFIILSFIIYLLGSKKLLINREKKLILSLLFISHFPVFLVHLLFAENIIFGYFGLGQLRLMLILSILSLISVFYPINPKIIKHTLIAIVLTGLANCIYAILAQLQIVELLYISSPRIPGFARHSGLLSVPASLGVFSGLNVVIGYWLYKEKRAKIGPIISIIGAAGLFLSISFTGILMVFVAVLFFYFREMKRNVLISFIIALFLFVAVIIILLNFDLILSQNIKRIESIGGSIKIWLNSYMIGIPWGEIDNYTDGFDMIFPHNWLLAFLVHGGTISFISLFGLYFFYLKRVYQIIKINNLSAGYKQILYLVITLLLISALFEQIFLLVPAVFILYIFIGFSTQSFEE
ncbi:hypothetical protein [Neobacillus niacini]|uniref:hypothetical protein n=1 Tax=Neobacillus niacini TaxID=86668 RepID=UPI003982DCAF